MGDGLRWGVESICAQLTESGAPIARSTYYEHRGRPATEREARDAELKTVIGRAQAQNFGVYGARKVWLTLNRERPAGAPPIARCTLERLMRELGLRGAARGKVKRTTISDPKAPKPHDLVNRSPFAYCDDLTPAAAEQAHYASNQTPTTVGDVAPCVGQGT